MTCLIKIFNKCNLKILKKAKLYAHNLFMDLRINFNYLNLILLMNINLQQLKRNSKNLIIFKFSICKIVRDHKNVLFLILTNKKINIFVQFINNNKKLKINFDQKRYRNFCSIILTKCFYKLQKHSMMIIRRQRNISKRLEMGKNDSDKQTKILKSLIF